MKINLNGIHASLRDGMGHLPDDYYAGGWADGLAVEAIPTDQADICLERHGSSCRIGYRDKIHFFRALGLLREYSHQQDISIQEQMIIPEIGVMLDASRNSVPSPGFLRRILDRMALMGLNRLILYMEDTYPMEDEPRFGYLRGGYTRQELRDLDDYADQYGIQIVPSIQVLGHLEKVLRYPEYASLRDSPSCLLVGSEGTAQLIEKMLKAMKACFRSPLVIVGMDETSGLGEGRYRSLHGDKPPIQLFLEHWRCVQSLADKLGLTIGLYSDMLFQYGSARHTYLDPGMRLEPAIRGQIPPASRLIYWDYYSADASLLSRMLQAHQGLGSGIIYAGPLLSVSSFCVHYQHTFETAGAALAAVKRLGIPMAYGCMWHDDGAECSDWLGLLGMQYYAEQAYSMEEPDQNKLARRFKACTSLDAAWFLDAAMLDEIPCMNLENRWPPNAGKYLLWQDPLEGLFDKDLDGLSLDSHYRRAVSALRKDLAAAGEAGCDGWFLKVPLALAEVLELKTALSEHFASDYQAGDYSALKQDLPLLASLFDKVKQLREAHRSQWMQTCSPFGWDRLDLRYGGLLARLETAQVRLNQYLNGEIDVIPELAAPRFPFDRRGDTLGSGIWKIYRNIATVSDGA